MSYNRVQIHIDKGRGLLEYSTPNSCRLTLQLQGLPMDKLCSAYILWSDSYKRLPVNVDKRGCCALRCEIACENPQDIGAVALLTEDLKEIAVGYIKNNFNWKGAFNKPLTEIKAENSENIPNEDKNKAYENFQSNNENMSDKPNPIGNGDSLNKPDSVNNGDSLNKPDSVNNGDSLNKSNPVNNGGGLNKSNPINNVDSSYKSNPVNNGDSSYKANPIDNKDSSDKVNSDNNSTHNDDKLSNEDKKLKELVLRFSTDLRELQEYMEMPVSHGADSLIANKPKAEDFPMEGEWVKINLQDLALLDNLWHYTNNPLVVYSCRHYHHLVLGKTHKGYYLALPWNYNRDYRLEANLQGFDRILPLEAKPLNEGDFCYLLMNIY